MAKVDVKDCKKDFNKKGGICKMGDAVYGLGFIGAVVYFIQHSHSLGEGIMAILKAIVWPALVVFKLLSFLKI
jgi:hypothetical protein